MAVSLSSPASSSPAPNRGWARISSTTRIPPSGATSATICRTEFEPMSIAATRSVRASPSPPLALAFAVAEGVLVARSGGRCRAPIFEVMLDLLALGEVHGVLADVRREIGHALEVATDEEQLERLRDPRRALHHVGEEN